MIVDPSLHPGGSADAMTDDAWIATTCQSGSDDKSRKKVACRLRRFAAAYRSTIDVAACNRDDIA
jgi:hypothetical protein